MSRCLDKGLAFSRTGGTRKVGLQNENYLFGLGNTRRQARRRGEGEEEMCPGPLQLKFMK